ncbi:UvrB/UvrC motif-containing protein [bacterium]|nr:UvrB/UvrC motif-containing protein [bacterium]
MKCDKCHKNEATIHYTEIVHNQMIKMNLCEQCAKNKGIGVQSPFSISDLLSGLAQIDAQESMFEEPVCKCCGLEFSGFRKTGTLGCSECYKAFKEPLKSLLKTIHKNIQHKGKKLKKGSAGRSRKVNVAEEIAQFKSELHKAVESENYERAAELRDNIKELEAKLKKD